MINILKTLFFIFLLSIPFSNLSAQENTYVLKFLHVNSKGWFTFKDDISNSKASICINNGNETKMYKTYFNVNSEKIYSTVNNKIERTIKFSKTISGLKNKEDKIGKYEYKEYEGIRYIGDNANPLNGKFQFGKLNMNNVQYYFLKFDDNQETLFIFN